MFGGKVRRKQNRLARALERASVPEQPFIGRGPRYIVHPEVAAACASSLSAIAAALRVDAATFNDAQLRAIRSFICNGAESAFFGRDVTAALREAVSLQHAVLRPTARNHDFLVARPDSLLPVDEIVAVADTVFFAPTPGR